MAEQVWRSTASKCALSAAKALIVILLSASPGLADSPDSAPAAVDGAAAPNKPLKGSVQQIELSLHEVRELGLDIKKVIHATGSLYDEVTMQPVSIVTQPEVVGMGTIIYIPVGTRPAGPPIPPRKERLDAAINALSPIIPLMKKDVDDVLSGERELNLTDDVRSELRPTFKVWVDRVNNMDQQYQALGPLIQGPQFDNQAIAAAATAIQQDAKDLEKARKKIYKVLQREGRKAKKNEKS